MYLLYLSQFLFLRALQKYSEGYLSSDHRTKVDPSSGPRLITCRKYNYLRPGCDQRIHEIRDFYPDLENDDLFVRKTGASHANPVVLQDFEYFRRSCQQGPWIEGEIVLQPRDGEEEIFPDLEKDDLTVRKTQPQKKEVPLSGAPDKYQPALFPDPWSLPPEIQAKFLCLLEKSTLKSECESRGKVLSPSSRQKKDDMLIQKMELLSLGGSVQRKSFSPGVCSKEDMEKWETIREASRIRHKKRQMVERSAHGHAWIVLASEYLEIVLGSERWCLVFNKACLAVTFKLDVHVYPHKFCCCSFRSSTARNPSVRSYRPICGVTPRLCLLQWVKNTGFCS